MAMHMYNNLMFQLIYISYIPHTDVDTVSWLLSSEKHTNQDHQLLGLARLIEISVNRSIYKRKTIIDMKIQKSVTFNDCSVYLFH